MGFPKSGLWVVYQMTIHGQEFAPNAVCTQGEWERMPNNDTGRHVLLRSGFTSEVEAERFARSRPAIPLGQVVLDNNPLAATSPV